MDKEKFISEIKSLCDGPEMPDHELYNNGRLPEGWESKYLALLESGRLYWQNKEDWPRNLMYCLYRVAFHHKFAYDEWSKKNGVNPETEESLGKIRPFTESFLTGTPNDKWEINI